MLANKSGGSNPLPIKLISFEAKKERKYGLVDMGRQPSRNKQLDHFELMRSKDGKGMGIFEINQGGWKLT